MNLSHKVSESWYAASNLYFKKHKPTIIYAPGRVGSMGLIKNLRQAGVFTFKVESLLNEPQGAAKFSKRFIINTKRPVNIITLVRDPLSMMCTYYYSKMIRGWIPGAKEAYDEQDIKKLQEIFIESVLNTKRLDSHLYWYENDWERALGFSIFDYQFDKDKQYSTFDHEQYSVLAMRTELPDTEKQTVLEEFLGAKPISITRENIRTKKPGSEGYQEFKETLHVPTDILEKIYSAPYVTHFFTTEEIASLKQTWS